MAYVVIISGVFHIYLSRNLDKNGAKIESAKFYIVGGLFICTGAIISTLNKIIDKL